MHACRGYFSALAVLSVIFQLFFSACILNVGFYNWSTTTHKRDNTFCAFHKYFLMMKALDTGAHFYILSAFI